jgi:hypothetical protein
MLNILYSSLQYVLVWCTAAIRILLLQHSTHKYEQACLHLAPNCSRQRIFYVCVFAYSIRLHFLAFVIRCNRIVKSRVIFTTDTKSVFIFALNLCSICTRLFCVYFLVEIVVHVVLLFKRAHAHVKYKTFTCTGVCDSANLHIILCSVKTLQ